MRHAPPNLQRALYLALTVGLSAGLVSACGEREPRTDAERLARGKEIVEKMSARLGGAQSFSVSTREARDQVKPSGEVQKVNITRETMVRRNPDRLYTKTAGDTQNEAWYDGVGLTLVLHKDKVFGQARMPETLDRTLDAMHERYGAAIPLADFVYTSPAKALLTDKTTGGWVARETVDGKQTDHLSFKDTGVNWDLWIPSTGEPLPAKATFELTDNKRLRKVELAFTDWNLSPQIANDRFTPTVPKDYEGIAMLQRARVLRNMPEGEAAPTSGETKSGEKK
jgi:hypothetical protein